MGYHSDNDEMYIDNYILNINKKYSKVPDELEARIRERIANVQKKRMSLIKTISLYTAASLAFMILFASTVKWVPAVAAITENIPVFGSVVKWINHDKGAMYAVNHGYMPAESVEIYKDGYKVVIGDVIIDEERLTFTAIASWQSSRKDLNFFKLNSYKKMPLEVNEFEMLTGFTYVYTWNGYKLGWSSSYPYGRNWTRKSEFMEFVDAIPVLDENDRSDGLEDIVLYMQYERTLELGELNEFLKLDRDYITLNLNFSETNSIENIKVPIDRNKILKSKVFAFDNTINLTHIDSRLNDLKISGLRIGPAAMYLDIKRKPDYVYVESFFNPRLEDDKGNVYYTENEFEYLNRRTHNDESTLDVLKFLPSMYFDAVPDKLYFKYDGFVIGESYHEFIKKEFFPHMEEAPTFTVDIKNGEYPINFKFREIEFKITNAYYKEGPSFCDYGKLILEYEDPSGINPSKMDHETRVKYMHLLSQGVERLVFSLKTNKLKCNGIGSWSNFQEKTDIEIDERDIYEFKIDGASYIVESKGEIPLILSKQD